MKNTERKILITDDHCVVRVGTGMILEEHLENISVDYAESYAQSKLKIRNERFDMILLDVGMPDSTFKFMVSELKTIQNDLIVMIFSSMKEIYAPDYIREGAEGFVNKLADEQTLVQAVETLFNKGLYYPSIKRAPHFSEKGIPIDKLSEREFQVFMSLAEGNGILEISNLLKLEVPTVSTYKRRIFKKLGISNIVELLNIYQSYQDR
ncbi:response regulator transcription factor [Chryseobacterium sp. sg2396]|nr:response regulator transcription factor [uncultured Chryseobacterium sp.]